MPHSASVAQLARAQPCQGWGRGFEPLCSHQSFMKIHRMVDFFCCGLCAKGRRTRRVVRRAMRQHGEVLCSHQSFIKIRWMVDFFLLRSLCKGAKNPQGCEASYAPAWRSTLLAPRFHKNPPNGGFFCCGLWPRGEPQRWSGDKISPPIKNMFTFSKNCL